MAAWVGGAVLFVVTSVHEQLFEAFDSTTKDQLAAIRFPDYYAFGFATVITGLVTGIIGLSGKQRISFALLTLAALGLMAFDYYSIYQPLLEVITPPGQVRTERFTELHTQSKHINQVGLTVALLATFIAAWPARQSSDK